MEDAQATVQPVREKFILTARMEQSPAIGALGVFLQGPWRDVTGAVQAQSRYGLEDLPVGYQLSSAELPPDGNYPGRMNFGQGGGAQAKKHQMVDRMRLRFRRDDQAVVVEGEGTNRVGRYELKGTCTRSGEGWDLELTRMYTPGAPRPSLTRADTDSSLHRKRQLDVTAETTEPRKPRAAAPPKGAWGAVKKEPVQSKTDPMPKKPPKKDVQRPCVAVVFNGPDDLASVHRCASVAAARAKCGELVQEKDCAIRASSDEGDGVLFPPIDPPPARLVQALAPPLAPHIVLVDVSAPDVKPRSWKPTISGFATSRRAANYSLHCYRTCGPRLTKLEWHAFDAHSNDAVPKLALTGDALFDSSLSITDFASLEAAAQP